MPLMEELSRQLRAELRPADLRAENKRAQSVGRGFPEPILEEFICILEQPSIHYEAVIGHLQTQHFRNPLLPDQPYHGLATLLTEIVYDRIYSIHIRNGKNASEAVAYLDGVEKLANKNKPLWIFSLNHDVVLESAAARLGLTVNTGFPESVRLPLPSPFQGQAYIEAEMATEEEMAKGLRFLQDGHHGINLIKLHGALDIFTFHDGKDILKIKSAGNHAASVLRSLRLVNEVLPYRPKNGVNIINEIMYADSVGEIQFLNRSILSGVYKYDEKAHQVVPSIFLREFQTGLHNLSKIYCCGYGFSDDHINKVLRHWLEEDARRVVEIVDPHRRLIPECFMHLAAQTTLQPMGVGNFLKNI